MLLKGLNHVAVITNDASRVNAFYREVFDAEILRDGSEFPDGEGPRLSIIKIGDWAELNVFQIEGNREADHQTPMFGRVASTTWRSRPIPSTRSRPSANA